MPLPVSKGAGKGKGAEVVREPIAGVYAQKLASEKRLHIAKKKLVRAKFLARLIPMQDTYFPTLGQALEAFATKVENGKGVFADRDSVFSSCDGMGVPYGQTVSRDFALASLKGKATKKFAHFSLYRMESGTYELTSYVL
jgi:hypothetical protein